MKRTDNTIIVSRGGVKVEMNFNDVANNRDISNYKKYLCIQNLEIVENRKVLLIGGGISTVRADLEDMGINTTITNLDFYFDFHKWTSHNHINEDFFEWDIPRNHFNEIWALYSLPYYSMNTADTKLFFAKVLLGLAPGGCFRCYPIRLTHQKFVPRSYSAHQKKQDSFEAISYIQSLGFKTTIIPTEQYNKDTVNHYVYDGGDKYTFHIEAPRDKDKTTSYNLALGDYISAYRERRDDLGNFYYGKQAAGVERVGAEIAGARAAAIAEELILLDQGIHY